MSKIFAQRNFSYDYYFLKYNVCSKEIKVQGGLKYNIRGKEIKVKKKVNNTIKNRGFHQNISLKITQASKNIIN